MNYKVFVAVAIGFVLALGSCKKDTNADGTPAPESLMSATIQGPRDSTAVIDSTQWTPFYPVTTFYKDKIVIIGTPIIPTTDIMTITIWGVTEKTYTLSIDVTQGLKTECGATLTSLFNGKNFTFAGKSGKVTITKIDTVNKRISGTFEFELINGDVPRTISNGKFENLDYHIIS